MKDERKDRLFMTKIVVDVIWQQNIKIGEIYHRHGVLKLLLSLDNDVRVYYAKFNSTLAWSRLSFICQ